MPVTCVVTLFEEKTSWLQNIMSSISLHEPKSRLLTQQKDRPEGGLYWLNV